MNAQASTSIHPALRDLHIVVGSASPRRLELISRLGCTPLVCTADIDETQRDDESAEHYVERLAREKAAAVRLQLMDRTQLVTDVDNDRHSDRGDSRPTVIISADTAVIAPTSDVVVPHDATTGQLVGRALGKPVDHDDARQMLEQLSGQSHYVATGVAICVLDVATSGRERSVVTAQDAAAITSAVEVTTVRFRTLSQGEINWYLHTEEGLDKAGGYAIQGQAAIFVESIVGDPTNVIGLPLGLTVQLIQQATASLAI